MIRDHRPYAVKKAYRRLERFYVNHYLRPQFTSLGDHPYIVRPWYVEVFGAPIRIGRCVNMIASQDMKVRLSVWGNREGEGRIEIGDYCLICPGVRVGAAMEIVIEDSVMLAHGAYVTDSDWHDIYNRIVPCQNNKPVHIMENAWIGDSAIVCKGVTVGRNSIVGAGAVVVNDVPPDTIVAGNPARVVRQLDPNEKMTTRESWFSDAEKLAREIDYLDMETLKKNTFRSWFRHLFFPAPGD